MEISNELKNRLTIFLREKMKMQFKDKDFRINEGTFLGEAVEEDLAHDQPMFTNEEAAAINDHATLLDETVEKVFDEVIGFLTAKSQETPPGSSPS